MLAYSPPLPLMIYYIGVTGVDYSLVLPQFGSVRFKGYFPRTLNRTIGPVRKNP